MRILHLSHTDIRSDSRILKEMQSIARLNPSFSIYGVGVVTRDKSSQSKLVEGINIVSINLLSRKLTLFPKFIRHSFSMVELTMKMLFKTRKYKPQLIHCHDTLVLPLGVLLKFIFGAKLVYDAHELESNRNGLSKFLSKATFLVEKFLWKFVDSLIVVSPSIKKWYCKYIGVKDTVVILNSPILIDETKKDGHHYFSQKFGIKETSLIFLYLGAICKGRAIDLILDVFKEFNDNDGFHVVFMGYGDMVSQVKKAEKHHNNIHYHESVPHEDVVFISQSADVGLCLIENVSLSDYYCLPNKLFEYAFSGIPVLASDFPDIVEVIDRHNLGSYCAVNKESIKSAIISLKDNKEFKNLKMKDLESLSWIAQEKKLIKLYNNLLGI
ncbi:glycosyltransferase [Psychrobacter sp. I-STPA6b]|uniref:glycosyltransferase n=1 Tax=Psychrobacter sp. I-STPA6b TaxID=2585718 RepID=UPI001D0C8958|nr:glycosyltransferase [Psychrobacter sp. I-STPA6b]